MKQSWKKQEGSQRKEKLKELQRKSAWLLRENSKDNKICKKPKKKGRQKLPLKKNPMHSRNKWLLNKPRENSKSV